MNKQQALEPGVAPDGVVFDFDGVIADAEPLHFRAFHQILKPMGLDFDWHEYLQIYIGFDDRDAFRELFQRRGRPLAESKLRELVNAKGQLFQRLIHTEPPPAFPGAIELIHTLEKNLPLALCSSATSADLLPLLQHLGIDNAFDVFVSADDVSRSKPDAEPYRRALKGLKQKFTGRLIRARYIVAIEDTPAGIISAHAAGLNVLAVSNSYPFAKLAAADKIVTTLKEVSPASLAVICHNGRAGKPDDGGRRQ